VFAYIEQHGLIPDEQGLTESLRHVGADNNLAAVKRLCKLGALWPEVLHNDLGYSWYGESLAWARAQGCTAPLHDSEGSDGGEFYSDEYYDSDGDDFDYDNDDHGSDAADGADDGN
jgi:hypothetical protein